MAANRELLRATGVTFDGNEPEFPQEILMGGSCACVLAPSPGDPRIVL
jgi:hypothetical protein